jgi:hypothetical protein
MHTHRHHHHEGAAWLLRACKAMLGAGMTSQPTPHARTAEVISSSGGPQPHAATHSRRVPAQQVRLAGARGHCHRAERERCETTRTHFAKCITLPLLLRVTRLDACAALDVAYEVLEADLLTWATKYSEPPARPPRCVWLVRSALRWPRAQSGCVSCCTPPTPHTERRTLRHAESTARLPCAAVMGLLCRPRGAVTASQLPRGRAPTRQPRLRSVRSRADVRRVLQRVRVRMRRRALPALRQRAQTSHDHRMLCLCS